MKIPGKGRLIKNLNINKASFIKGKLQNQLTKIFPQDFSQIKDVSIELVSFSGNKALLDQLLSISSFIYSVGIPTKWTIYSDGSYTKDDIQLLTKWPFLEIIEKNQNASWQLNKFFAFAQHVTSGATTIYLDSDILFFRPFAEYLSHLEKDNWVLPENKGAFVLAPDFKHLNKKFLIPINAGFFIANSPLNWSAGIDYILGKESNNSSYFIDQEALNLTFEATSRINVLDPRYFLLTTCDQFKFGLAENKLTAMRHYVGPIRHKMYLSYHKNFTQTI